MTSTKNLIDELKDPVVRILESMLERVVLLENQVDAMLTQKDAAKLSVDGELELIAATVGRMAEAMQAMKLKVDDLEAWSNVHTHAEPKAAKPSKAARLKAARDLGDKRGKFCLYCHKVLDPKGRNQRIFCSPGHASKWYREHPGETPYPLTVLHAGGFETKVTAGEAVESEAYAARP